jgi:addiction module RelB/DinJ family antitoxin
MEGIMRDTVVQTRIESDVKSKAEKIFGAFGLTINDGIRIFLNQVLIDKGLPFRPTLSHYPNIETRQAIEDTDEGRDVKTFTSVKALPRSRRFLIGALNIMLRMHTD